MSKCPKCGLPPYSFKQGAPAWTCGIVQNNSGSVRRSDACLEIERLKQEAAALQAKVDELSTDNAVLAVRLLVAKEEIEWLRADRDWWKRAAQGLGPKENGEPL